MKKTLVTETALRDLVNEAFETPPPFDVALITKDEDLPVMVNPSVDDSLVAVELTPVDVQFVPRDHEEFELAIKQMAKNLPDDIIPRLYAKVREVMMDAQADCEGPEDQGDTEEMEKRDNARLGMEESIRKAIRAMLIKESEEKRPEDEVPGDLTLGDLAADEDQFDGDDDADDFDLPEPEVPFALAGGTKKRTSAEDDIAAALARANDPAWDEEPGEDLGGVHGAAVDKEEDEELFGDDPWDTSDVDAETTSEWDPEPLPKEKKRKEHETGYGVEGDQLRKLADELGISPSGVERLMNTGLAKLKYMSELSDADVKDILTTASRDWVEKLVDKGRLDDKEGRTWLRAINSGMTDDSGHTALENFLKVGEFRDFLNDYIKDEMELDDEWPYAEDPSTMKKDDAGKPIKGSGKIRHRSLFGKPTRGSKEEE